jgi:hypothetical protein
MLDAWDLLHGCAKEVGAEGVVVLDLRGTRLGGCRGARRRSTAGRHVARRRSRDAHGERPGHFAGMSGRWTARPRGRSSSSTADGGARRLLPEACRRAAVGEPAIMATYVGRERLRPRRAWIWHARRVLLCALGPGGPVLATSLTVARSVAAGVGLVADGTGGAVMILLGDARREAQLREGGIRSFPVDPDGPAVARRPAPGGCGVSLRTGSASRGACWCPTTDRRRRGPRSSGPPRLRGAATR